MPVELLSRDLVHTTDAIALPPTEVEVLARAERRDSYPIAVTRSPDETIERLLQLVGERRVAVITDETVAGLYGPLVIGALAKAGVAAEVATVPAGERHKTLRQAFELVDWLTGTQLGRRDLILLLGGGVVIDMGGWVASAYMRGLPFINLPTTLIAQVDAGIGGIAIHRHLFLLYVLSGALSGSAGLIEVARFAVASVSTGHTTELIAALAAVVIGGASLTGGVGIMSATVVGVFIPVILANGLLIGGVERFWQDVVVGVILVAAVWFDQWRRAQEVLDR